MASLKKNSLYIYVCQQSQSINKVPTRFDVYIKGSCNDFFAAMVSVGPPCIIVHFLFCEGMFSFLEVGRGLFRGSAAKIHTKHCPKLNIGFILAKYKINNPDSDFTRLLLRADWCVSASSAMTKVVCLASC
jgi:hypothetical protein